jgi:hypothetical protein
MSQKKKSFVHIMYKNQTYNNEFIKLINEENILDKNEHLFVIVYNTPIACLQNYDNVIYKIKFNLRDLYQYSKKTHYIILHSFSFSIMETLLMKNSITKKLVWFVWGHDLYKRYSNKFENKGFMRHLYPLYIGIKKIVWNFIDKKLQKLKAILVCFNADEDEAKQRFGNDKVHLVIYPSGYYYNDINPVQQNKQNSTVIMIGHSSFRFLQHKKYLDKLHKYVNEDIKILLPLAYGDVQYAKDTVAYALNLFPHDKLIVLREKISWNNYIELLNTVDIAIFDYNQSSALGNIFILLALGKKLYLSDKGAIAKGLSKSNIYFCNCEDIGNISFDELRKFNILSNTGKEYAKITLGKDNIVHNIKSFFDNLK